MKFCRLRSRCQPTFTYDEIETVYILAVRHTAQKPLEGDNLEETLQNFSLRA